MAFDGGFITTYAGGGAAPGPGFGDNGQASLAVLSQPGDLTLGPEQPPFLYISDTGPAHERIRRVDPVTGVITTWYGSGGCAAAPVAMSQCQIETGCNVVFDGRDMEGADESAPYASRFESPYPATKAQAERLVLAASSAELATVALRPHLIWGPGDNHLIPRIVARAREIVREHCGQHGVAYTETTLPQAWRRVIAHLNEVGRAAPRIFECPVAARYSGS